MINTCQNPQYLLAFIRMKKSLITLGTSVCVLLTFPSCQSTPKMANGGYEEATMASDTIADGEIPPWLLEDDSTSPSR